MQIEPLHEWQLNIRQALGIQHELAPRVCRDNYVTSPRLIAGMDVSIDRIKGIATAAVVVLKYPELEAIETKVAQDKITFPYVPGLLSFRELPLTLKVFQELKSAPDMVMVDGQGIAHPRRMGLASHLGLFLNIPTIGCAKSLLCGEYEEPGGTPGSFTLIIDRGETIGAALRTRIKVKPVFVSIGHKIDLPAAIQWVSACCRELRLPEPTRKAHFASRSKAIVNNK